MSAVVQDFVSSRRTPRPAAEAGSELALSARGLAKAYAAGGETVLHGVDLRLHAGERVALLGANGSGKSTLLRCCLRLVEPSGGEVTLFGQDVLASRGRSLRRLRAQVGFVFQRHNLVPRLSVLSNVLHGAQARSWGPCAWFQGVAAADHRDAAMACLERVGLAGFAGRRADQLSGGQSQRVAIARMLMQRPRLVFADEPAASLDPSAGESVMALLADVTNGHGQGVLFTSHDLDHARRYADRVIALKQGRVVLDDAVGAVDFDALGSLYQRGV